MPVCQKESGMNQKAFSFMFVTINLFFIFFLIFKNSRIIELTFAKQKREKEKNALAQQKEILQQKLFIAQSRSSIKEYASKELKMEKITLKDIKHLQPTNG